MPQATGINRKEIQEMPQAQRTSTERKSKECPKRPERAAPPSPGQRPGYVLVIIKRPVRAKALQIIWYFKAFALTGRLVCVHDYPGRCPGLGASALSGRVANRGDLLISILLSCGESGRFDLFQSS